MKRIQLKCDSGLMGWESDLRTNYDNSKAQFVANSETYGIAERLGFSDADAAWLFNPIIQGSVQPSDFRISRVMIGGGTFTVEPQRNTDNEIESYNIFGLSRFPINSPGEFPEPPTFEEILELVETITLS